MQHLGDRVTALVDDALDEREWASVQDHLLVCEQCRDAVRRERHLKSRMTCGPMSPAPPAALVAALADRRVLADHVARQERRRTAAVHAAVTAGGLCASLAMLGLLVGGSSPLQTRQAAASTGGFAPRGHPRHQRPGTGGPRGAHGHPDGAGRPTGHVAPTPVPVAPTPAPVAVSRSWPLGR
jgi:hypothetical protein